MRKGAVGRGEERKSGVDCFFIRAAVSQERSLHINAFRFSAASRDSPLHAARVASFSNWPDTLPCCLGVRCPVLHGASPPCHGPSSIPYSPFRHAAGACWSIGAPAGIRPMACASDVGTCLIAAIALATAGPGVCKNSNATCGLSTSCIGFLVDDAANAPSPELNT